MYKDILYFDDKDLVWSDFEFYTAEMCKLYKKCKLFLA